jgi:positive regulator of sigma E activity
MLKFYKDNKIWFAVVWIVAYCVLMSIGDALSDLVGVQKCITLPVAFLMTAVLFIFIKKYSLAKENGLCKPELPAKTALFYL